ncbi:carbohydrate ABC transporter permease [Paenibacillus thermoaerophilus]|uniref:Carbohydrate ABC transporter permease n=1 Tax=Paenibacillus thermoaerophilus TaxID=1215385 RepID=A0ABW2UZ15_9BACL|nr:sugar ABC transporter permease [Paenibacillus thermoaerophilus]TMV17372.1 sugar ABC transporter permease [Paenibacillus thermoaerophilus]
MVGHKHWARRTAAFVLLLPGVSGLLLFQLIPMVSSGYISLTDWDLLTEAEFVGLDNYVQVFQDEKSLMSIKNVFRFIIGYLPLVLVFGLLFAVLLNRKMRGVKLYRAIVFIPVITSWIAVSIVWKWILNGKSGLLNYVLSLAGIEGPVWLQDFFWAMPAVIMVTVWKDAGFVAIILLAGLQDISEDYYEAAHLDGAGSTYRFFNITLPLLTPALFFVITISLINAFQLFDQVMILTNGGPAGSTSTLVEQVYKNAFQNHKMGFAAAQSWVLFLIIFAVTYLQYQLQKRWVTYDR